MSFSSIHINHIVSKQKIKAHDRDELVSIIEKEIDSYGYDVDLNHIDVSEITDFYGVFGNSKFVGDISKWDVSKGENFSKMFFNSEFNSNILSWDVSSGKYFDDMFANSKFNKDIGIWDMSNAVSTYGMFSFSKFDQDINMWDVSNVRSMPYMFAHSDFSKPLDDWKPRDCVFHDMFSNKCFISDHRERVPEWYVLKEKKYHNAVNSMPNRSEFIDKYHGLTREMLDSLDLGIHSVYLDRATGEVIGHDTQSESIELLYTFIIKENYTSKDLDELHKKIKNCENDKLFCVYANKLYKIYPMLFIKSLNPWKTKQNPYTKYNSSVPLYLLKTVNWYAELAGLPRIKKNSVGGLEFE